MALLHMPRCSLPDVQADGNGRRTKRFVTTGYKWDKLHLTWRIEDYSSDLSQGDQEGIVMDALQFWSDVSALTFEMAADPMSADIVIAFSSGDHGDAYPFDGDDLAHAFLPFDLSDPIAGDIHLNDAITWGTSTPGTNLTLVIAHELGHSLGLSHSQDISSLMYSFYDRSPVITSVNSDDIDGIRALYGVKCGAPPDGVNTVSVGMIEGVPGEEYNYTCSPGFRANPSDLLVVCEQHNTTITASWSPAPPTCTAFQIVCKKITGTINCGEQLINIVSAVWGRTDASTCGSNAVTTCELDVIIDMSPLCDNMTSCEFTPRGSLFSGQNPCKGVRKYLNIAHTCEDGPTTTQMATTTQPTTTPMATTTQPTTTQMTTTPPPMNVTACKDEPKFMNCTPENVVICSAFYGRNSSTMCASSNANTASMCFVDVTELMQDRWCKNVPICSALALGQLYNNHCGSNPQAYLQVTYTCGAGQCGSTQPDFPDIPVSK